MYCKQQPTYIQFVPINMYLFLQQNQRVIQLAIQNSHALNQVSLVLRSIPGERRMEELLLHTLIAQISKKGETR